jgi:hypothetical protein
VSFIFHYLFLKERAPMSNAPGLKKLIVDAVVDFGKFSKDYAIHRPGLPESFYNRLYDTIPSFDKGTITMIHFLSG